MKFFRLHDEAFLPTLKGSFYEFRALESIRIEPQKIALVHTGVSFKDMPENLFLQLTISPEMFRQRPFLMSNVYLNSDDNQKEIVLVVWNRSDIIPAVIDQGEKIAVGTFLEYRTTDDTPKNTKTRSKKLQHIEKM